MTHTSSNRRTGGLTGRWIVERECNRLARWFRIVPLWTVVALATSSPSASNPVADDPAVRNSLEAHIAAREYWASETERGLQAPNRMQNLRSIFEPSGVRVHDRTDQAERLLIDLRLAGLGRGEKLSPVAAGELSHHEGRIEIARPKLGLVEWFENSPAGLEQGFTLQDRPDANQDGSLVLELALAGAKAQLLGESVGLSTEAGRQLGYGQLVVEDARGERLLAHFEVPTPDRIRVVVEDASATYPIVVDPVVTNVSDGAVPSLQTGALLGSSVASAGDVNGDGFDDVVIGAPSFDNGQTNEGAAFLFLGSASGIGSGAETTADATIESNQASAALGTSVASAGDVNGDGFADVLIGAPFYSGPEFLEGAAFLFLGSASGIPNGSSATANARFESNQASVGVGGPLMGHSVASAGDVNGDGYSDVLIGAPRYAAGQDSEGAAFLYLGSSSGIPNGSPATANTRFESDQVNFCLTIVSFERCPDFGMSVASAGDVDADGFSDVLIGAPGYNNDETDEGAVFLWRGSALGIPNGNPANAHTFIESNQGFVSFVDGGAAMGESVSSAGDINGDGYGDIVVGAPTYDVQNQNEGSAFVFLGSATGVASGSPATAHVQIERDFPVQARLGQSVAVGGDINGDGYGDVLVGGENTDRVLIYFGSAAGLPNAGSAGPNAQLVSSGTGGRYGSAVASAGDVNGDGYDDVIVGARLDGPGGQAFVYHGGHASPLFNANGFLSTRPFQAFVFPLSSSIDQIAVRVAGAGDVNGDGFGDFVVGVPDYDNGEIDEGAAFVFLGSAGFPSPGNASTAHARFESNQAGAQLGDQVASAGDVNGDGFADLIVGAPGYDGPEIDEGAAFVFLGSATGFANGSPATAHARYESNQAGARLGRVASVGDVNGDGHSDVVVGAPLFDAPEIDEGSAFVYLGSAVGLSSGNPTTAHARFESNLGSSRLGWSARSAGDVNADGFDDLVVGAPQYSALLAQGGGAFVFHGSATGLANGNPATAASRIQGNLANSLLGYSVDSAGDFNGDGYADLVVGAPTPGALAAVNTGNVYFFLGSQNGIGERSPLNADWAISGRYALTDTFFAFRYGQDVAGAGDLDNDGFGDVVITSLVLTPPANLTRFAEVHSGAPNGSTRPLGFSRILVGQSLDLGHPSHDANAGAAGDVNGDGIADLIVGGASSNGDRAATVHFGYGLGRFVGIRQIKTGGLIPLGGLSYSSSQFSLERDMTSPRGRERARLEIEVCAVGLPFGHPSCIRAIPSPFWSDLGLTGSSIGTGVAGLTPNQRYSWRSRAQYVAFSGNQPGIVPTIKKGPWFRVHGRATPGDFRTLPEPGLGIGIVVGLISMALAGRSRRFPGPRGDGELRGRIRGETGRTAVGAKGRVLVTDRL